VLNTQSRLEAHFSGARRSLRLVQGQAWFEVSKESRPFVVEAGDRRIVAHGTAFDVRVDADDRVQVTLIEGRVSVEDGVSEQTFLEPGQTLVAAAHQAETVGSADIERVTSWREGRLVFRNDRLIDAVKEVNRYTTAKLVVSDDPELHDLRISGVFDAGRTATFLLALESGHAVSSRPVSSDRILLVR
jgi:transmembrane sensor